jgi:hypothetical protein
MFNTKMTELQQLGTTFANAFTALAVDMAKSADEEIATIRAAAGKLIDIDCMQLALANTAVQIVDALEQVADKIDTARARNEIVLDYVGDMNDELASIEDDEPAEEEDGE